MKARFLILLAALLLLALPGCRQEEGGMRDGYYTAGGAGYDSEGWKPMITLYVYDNQIVTVEYGAINSTGLLLDWDVHAVRAVKERTRTHPNKIVRKYIQDLLDRQNPQSVRRYVGDTYFYESFVQLSAAAMDQARLGDKKPVEVELVYE